MERRCSFKFHVLPCWCKPNLACLPQVVVTAFAAEDFVTVVPASTIGSQDTEQPKLIFNVYHPKLSKSADIDVPHSMQKMMTGDRTKPSLIRHEVSEATHDVLYVLAQLSVIGFAVVDIWR